MNNIPRNVTFRKILHIVFKIQNDEIKKVLAEIRRKIKKIKIFKNAKTFDCREVFFSLLEPQSYIIRKS